MRALFVASDSAMNTSSVGGVQVCVQEFLETLQRAGYELTTMTYHGDRSLRAKVARRLTNRPYSHLVPRSCVDEIDRLCRSRGITTVFLYSCDLAGIAGELKRRLPNLRLVLLSYGLESMDYLHTVRSRVPGHQFQSVSRYEERRLARQLIAECSQRRFIDDVVCLSAVEAEIERWLGARRVTWVPRTIPRRPLAWDPVINRVGFIGTLDHPPNAEGLVLFLRALEEQQRYLQVRVIGGPVQAGESIASQFAAVEYLGPLSDSAAWAEAATWACFVHPIFCFARGASTKLAIGLAWDIPIVTTEAGCRGYSWQRGSLTIGNTPEAFATAVGQLAADKDQMEAARAEARLIVESSPTLDSIAALLRNFLDRQGVESDQAGAR